MSNVKNRLAELIRKSKFTKKELAHEIKVNPRTITRWERSESPIPSDKIKILADLLDTNIAYLLGQSDFNLNEITHVGKDYFGDDINILQRDRLEYLKTLKNDIDILKNTSISAHNEAESITNIISSLNSLKHDELSTKIYEYALDLYDLVLYRAISEYQTIIEKENNY